MDDEKLYTVLLSDDDIDRMQEGGYDEVEFVCQDLMRQVEKQNAQSLRESTKQRLEDLFYDTIFPALAEDFEYASDEEARAVIDLLAHLVKTIPVIGINVKQEVQE